MSPDETIFLSCDLRSSDQRLFLTMQYQELFFNDLRYGGVVPQLVSFIYSEFSVVVMFFIYTIQEEG